MNLLPVDILQKRMLLDLVDSVSPQSLRWIPIEQSETKVKRLQSRKTINHLIKDIEMDIEFGFCKSFCLIFSYNSLVVGASNGIF